MKKYAILMIKHTILFLAMFFCVALENSVPVPMVVCRISLVMSMCLCILKTELFSVAIGAVCGFFADVYLQTVPCFSLLYLYISAGCVWSAKCFVSIKKKTVFIICSLWFFVFFAGEFLINFLIFEKISAKWSEVFFWLLFSGINAAFSPIIYDFFKRAKY